MSTTLKDRIVWAVEWPVMAFDFITGGMETKGVFRYLMLVHGVPSVLSALLGAYLYRDDPTLGVLVWAYIFGAVPMAFNDVIASWIVKEYEGYENKHNQTGPNANAKFSTGFYARSKRPPPLPRYPFATAHRYAMQSDNGNTWVQSTAHKI